MSYETFLKWVLELATQEYKGDIGVLKLECRLKNLKLEGSI